MINIPKLLNVFKNAFVGIGHAWHTQQSFRIQVVFAFLTIILGFLFSISLIEWLLVLSAILGVIVAELLNTAVELTVDLITMERSKRAQLTKDIAAGAVLIIVLWAITLGIVIFVPKFIALIGALL